MPIDLKEYKGSINFSHVWKVVLAFALAYLFYAVFLESWNKVLVDGILSKFPQNVLMDFFCIILLSYVIIKIIEAVDNQLRPALSSVLVIGFILLFYLMFIRFNKHYYFYTFSYLIPGNVAYADILLLLSCALGLDFKAYNTPLEKRNATSLITDEPDPDNTVDLIRNDTYVQRITSVLNATSGKSAYAIGIFSSWGTGKTDFLLRLRKRLEENKQENIVLEFNAWKAASPESVLEDFSQCFPKA